MSFTTDFVERYRGKTIGYPTLMFRGECLSLTKRYIEERYKIYPPPSGCNSARCYWSKFPDPLGTVLKRILNTPDLVPEEGWIAVWDEDTGNGYGHIGVVLEGADVNQFTSFDQNWGGRHAHKVKHNYDNVYGFLVPLDEGGDMVEVPSDKFEELVTKSTKYDEFVAAGYNEVSDVNKLKQGLDNCNESKDQLKGAITELQRQIREHECPIVTPPDEEIDWELNGKTEKYTEGGVEITKNYAVRG